MYKVLILTPIACFALCADAFSQNGTNEKKVENSDTAESDHVYFPLYTDFVALEDDQSNGLPQTEFSLIGNSERNPPELFKTLDTSVVMLISSCISGLLVYLVFRC